MVTILRGEFFEGSGLYLKARISGGDNNLLSTSSWASAGITNIYVKIFDSTDLAALAGAGAGSSLTDTLVPVYEANFAYTNVIVPLSLTGWTEDLIGYNFAYVFTTQYDFQGGHTYRIEFRFNTLGGNVYTVFEVACKSTGS